MAKFTKVTKDKCISCGACGGIAPEIYDYDEDGYAETIYNNDNNTGTMEISAELYEDLIDAAEGCPTEAIEVSDTPFD